MLLDELLRVNFKEAPPTDVHLKVIGNLVNQATGRGKITPQRSQFYSEFLWAPKLLASRIQSLLGQPLWGAAQWKGSGKARWIVAKEYASVIMSGYLLYQLSRLFDEKKEKEPTATDFGKIVRGDVRIDPWAGYQQVTVFGSRVATATTTTLKGDKRDIGAAKKYGQRGVWYLMADQIRSKLRPDVGTFVDVISRSDFIGRPLATKQIPGYAAQNLLVPLPMRNIADIMKANGFTEGMITEALGQFGAGINYYEKREGQR